MDHGPIFLCGAPRSGTTLLSNLLDWNGKYLVFPEEKHILLLFNNLPKKHLLSYFLRDYLNHHDLRLYLDPSYLSSFNDYLEETYGSQAELSNPRCDPDRFTDAYLSVIRGEAARGPIDEGTVYRALHKGLVEGFDSIREQAGGIVSFIEKRPFDNELSAIRLKQIFPAAKFVHILRDPRTRYISSKTRAISRLRTRSRVYGLDFPSAHALIATTSFYCAKLNATVLRDDYLVIKYEDLVADRRGMMERVAAFLEIPFTEALLQQTRLGMPVRPTSSFKDRPQEGSSATLRKRLEGYVRGTSAAERYIVDYYCGAIAREFGYDLPEVRKLEIRALWRLLPPIKNESPLDYVPNRLHYLKELRGVPQVQTQFRVDAILRDWYAGKVLAD